MVKVWNGKLKKYMYGLFCSLNVNFGDFVGIFDLRIIVCIDFGGGFKLWGRVGCVFVV